MIKLIKPLVIAIMLILTTNETFAKKKEYDRYYVCWYKDGKDCTNGGTLLSCGYDNVEKGSTPPCSDPSVEYTYDEGGVKKVAGSCCTRASIMQTPPDIFNVAVGNVYSTDSLTLNLVCNSGDEISDVFYWGAYVPEHWSRFSYSYSLTATDLVISIFKRDKAIEGDSFININVSLASLSALCPNDPGANKLNVFGNTKITRINKVDFKVTKNASEDLLLINFLNNEVPTDPSLKISIFSIDGKLISTLNYNEELESIRTKFSLLPKGILIITASTNNDTYTLKYLVE